MQQPKALLVAEESEHMMVVRFILLFIFLSFPKAWANNLQLSNLDEVNINTAANAMTFSCNLSQDNSWYNSYNFDAVWVFMKYSPDGGATWKHAHMAGSGINPAGFSLPAAFQNQFEIVVPSDQTGFFVQRTGPGTGNINLTGLQFVWNYGQDGVSSALAQAANTLHTVYGIEMVYVPQGAFQAGDGNGNFSNEYPLGGANPWYIQSERAITTTASGSAYYYQNSGASGDEYPNGAVFTVPASYPKGFNAFYLMKYELTEGQWVSFFNTLPLAVRPYRDITSNNLGGKNSQGVVYRNTISWNAGLPSSPATTSRPSRPVSFVSWPDVAAYAAWAALRPITELEFEKAARGKDNQPLAGEYVWGSTAITAATSGGIVPNADENGVETLSDGSNINANAGGFSSGDGRSGGIAAGQAGPLRVGIFAASASNPTRQSSGSGFYGNMELSGDLAQPVVTVGRPESVGNFQGTNGTGNLNVSGFATNNDWPGFNPATSQVDHTIGIGYRGGDFLSPSTTVFMTSARTYAVRDPDSQGCAQRYSSTCGVFQGGRLGRSAS